jgi:hypothetical protein
MAPTAAANEPPGPARGYVVSGGEICGSERVDNLFDTWPIQRDFLVISIAEMSKRELVVTTLIWLKGDFTTRSPNSLGQLAGGFLVLLRLVIHLEGTGATKNERSGDSSVTGTSENLSTVHIISRNRSPFVNLLPFNLGAGEGHLDDLTRFRA